MKLWTENSEFLFEIINDGFEVAMATLPLFVSPKDVAAMGPTKRCRNAETWMPRIKGSICEGAFVGTCKSQVLLSARDFQNTPLRT